MLLNPGSVSGARESFGNTACREAVFRLFSGTGLKLPSVSPPRQLALCVAGALVLVGLLIVPMPVWVSSPWGRILQDAFHFPAFALLLILIDAICRQLLPTGRRGALLAAILLTITVGGASEWAQAFTARTASWEDFLLDLMEVERSMSTVGVYQTPEEREIFYRGVHGYMIRRGVQPLSEDQASRTLIR